MHLKDKKNNEQRMRILKYAFPIFVAYYYCMAFHNEEYEQTTSDISTYFIKYISPVILGIILTKLFNNKLSSQNKKWINVISFGLFTFLMSLAFGGGLLIILFHMSAYWYIPMLNYLKPMFIIWLLEFVVIFCSTLVASKIILRYFKKVFLWKTEEKV